MNRVLFGAGLALASFSAALAEPPYPALDGAFSAPTQWRIPAGSFAVGSGYNFNGPADLIAQGQGFQTSVLTVSGAGTVGLTIGVPGSDVTQDVSLRDLGVVGSVGTGHNIVFNSLHSADVDRVRTSHAGGDGVYAVRSYATSYRMLYSSNNAGSGFRASAPVAGIGNDNILFWGGHLLANGAKGFWSEGQLVGGLLAGVDVEGNGVGIQIDGGSGNPSYSNTLLSNYLETQVGKNIVVGNDAGAAAVPAFTMIGNVVHSGQGNAATNATLLDRVRSGFLVDNLFSGSNLTVTTNTARLMVGPNEFSGSVGPWAPSASSSGYKEPITYLLSGVGPDMAYGLAPVGWNTRHLIGSTYSGSWLSASANISMTANTGTGAPFDTTVGASDLDLGPNKINLWRAPAGSSSMTNVLAADSNGTAIPGLKVDVIPTASLPSAGSAQDGRLIIEDTGSGARNLIVYAGGVRTRISGGATF